MCLQIIIKIWGVGVLLSMSKVQARQGSPTCHHTRACIFQQLQASSIALKCRLSAFLPWALGTGETGENYWAVVGAANN